MIVTEPRQATETSSLNGFQRVVEWFSNDSISLISKVSVVAFGLFVAITFGSLTGHLGLSLVTAGTIGTSVIFLQFRPLGLRKSPESEIVPEERIETVPPPSPKTPSRQLSRKPKSRLLGHIRSKGSTKKESEETTTLKILMGSNNLNPNAPSQPFHTRLYNNVVASIGNVVETGKRLMNEPPSFNPSLLQPQLVSSNTSIAGSLPDHFRIGCINGMHTEETGRDGHMAYITNIAQNATIEWVYNRTHGRVADLAETFVLNYNGISPNTGNLLLANWTNFHEKYRDIPGAKYFQICHSQGALHVRNQLMKASPEIRDRVIVLAIAPAAVVPRHICYQSFNYACSSDLVLNGEIVSGLFALGRGNYGPLNNAIEHRPEIVWLDAPPNSSGLHHGFQNPVFKEVIERHIQEYLNMNGLYGVL